MSPLPPDQLPTNQQGLRPTQEQLVNLAMQAWPQAFPRLWSQLQAEGQVQQVVSVQARQALEVYDRIVSRSGDQAAAWEMAMDLLLKPLGEDQEPEVEREFLNSDPL